MSERRTQTTSNENGPATIWKDGQQIAEGYLRATIARNFIVFHDGERVEGVPDYQAVLEKLTPPLYDLSDVVVKACGRTIPCNVNSGRVRPSGSITPAI